MGDDFKRKLRHLKRIVKVIRDAREREARSERGRLSRSNPIYHRYWLELCLLCECGEGHFRILHDKWGVPFFACSDYPRCRMTHDSTTYGHLKHAIISELMAGREPDYEYFLRPYEPPEKRRRGLLRPQQGVQSDEDVP